MRLRERYDRFRCMLRGGHDWMRNNINEDWICADCGKVRPR